MFSIRLNKGELASLEARALDADIKPTVLTTNAMSARAKSPPTREASAELASGS